MAYIVESLTTGTNGTITDSITFETWFENQQSGDYILIAATNDSGTTVLGIDVGWTELHGPAASNSNSRTGVWYQKNTGTALENPTITGYNDDWAITAILIRDADETNFVDASAVTNQTSITQTPTCPSVTTTTDNCLMLYILGRDGNGTSRQAAGIGQGVTISQITDNLGATSCSSETIIEANVQLTAGATSTYVYHSGVSDGGTQMTVAIRNKSGGKVLAYPVTPPWTPLFNIHTTTTASLLYNLGHTTLLGVDVRTNDISGGAIVNSITQQDSLQAPLGDYGHRRSLGQTHTANTGLPGVYGAAYVLPSVVDLSDSIFCTFFDGQGVSSSLDNAGPVMYFRDSAGAWVLWRKMNETVANIPRGVFVYLPSETFADSGGGTIDWSDITHIGTAYKINSVVTSSLSRATIFKNMYAIPLSGSPMIVAGGSSGAEIDFRNLNNVLNSGFAWGFTYNNGSKQNISRFPIQIGNGGTNPVHFDGNANAFEFTAAGVGNWIREDDLEFRIKLGANDSFSLGAASIGSATRQKFVVDSSSSISGSYDFGGTIFGMNPEFISGIEVAGTTFTGCGKIVGSATSFDSCSVVKSASSDSAMRVAGGASVTSCHFTKGSETYAIEILGGGPIAVDLSDSEFTGYTKPLNILGTTGTVTITLAIGQSEPTYDTAGATVVFDQQIIQATASVAGFTDGSRLIVYNQTEDVEVYNGIISGANTWTLNYDNGTTFTDGDIVDVFQIYYRPDGEYASRRTKVTTVAGVGGWNALIDEQQCTIYDSYFQTFGTIGKDVYDSGEFEWDGINIEIDIDDTDGTWFAHRLFQWYKYALWFTGNRELFLLITPVDAGTLDIGTLKLDNLSSTNYIQGDTIRVKRTDLGYPIANPTTGGGGIDVIWQQPVLTTSSGGISPSEVQVKSWVRDELTPELNKVNKIDKLSKLIPAAVK